MLIIFKNDIETFQFLKTDNGFQPIIHVDVTKKNVIVSLPVADYTRCEDLCKTTPRCNAFNYALNECTLYRNIDYSTINHIRRWW